MLCLLKELFTPTLPLACYVSWVSNLILLSSYSSLSVKWELHYQFSKFLFKKKIFVKHLAIVSGKSQALYHASGLILAGTSLSFPALQ